MFRVRYQQAIPLPTSVVQNTAQVDGARHDHWTSRSKRPTSTRRCWGSATYRSLGEQRLSPPEERFEKGRRTVGLCLAPLVTVVFLVLPWTSRRNQQTLAGVLLGVIVLWITEAVPIPIGGLLGVAVVVFLDVAPVDDVLGPFGSSTIFTFIGAFILAQAMLKHGLARRFAFRILALPRVGHLDHRGDHRVRRHHRACCRRSCRTPPPWPCCCRPRSASSR